MNNEEKLIAKYGRDNNMSVPEGYFDSVFTEIANKLPPYPQAPVTLDLTIWQRVKPYIYLAAMFAGIWCMMKMFHIATNNANLSLDNPPEQIALAMSDYTSSEDFVLSNYYSDIELENEVISEYSDIEDFEKDFGYDVDSRYDNLTIK